MASTDDNSHEPASHKGRGKPWLSAVVFVLAHAWFTIGPNLRTLNVNHFDALGQLPWMHRWADPGLFPDDPMIDYPRRFHFPPGLRAIYFVLLQWVGAELNIACRIVPALAYLSAICLFLAVVRLTNRESSPQAPREEFVTRSVTSTLLSPAMALAAAAAILIPFDLISWRAYSPFSRFDGGLARAAGASILLAAMYGIAKPSRIAVSLAIIGGALFYPPACVIAATAAGLAALSTGTFRRVIEGVAWLLPAAVVCGSIVWRWYPLGVDPRFGPMVSRDDIAWAPEIVRLHFPFGDSLGAVLYSWVKACGLSGIAVALQALVCGRGRLLRANLVMLGAGLATTLAAYFLWPRLYEIDRYELWPRCVVLVVALAEVMVKVLDWVSRRCSWSPLLLAYCSLAGYVAFNVALGQYRSMRSPPTAAWAEPGRFGRRVIDLLVESSKDTRTASLGDELDAVPMFAKRSLFISANALWPYHREFHRAMVNRYLAVQEATYATDAAPIRRLRDEFGVRYLGVHRARFDPARFEQLAGSYIVSAWLPERLAPILIAGPHREFFLKNPPRSAVAIEEGDYQLIDLEQVR